MPFSESVPKLFTVKLYTAAGFSFAFALILSMAVAGYSLHSVRQFQESEVWVGHTQQVLQALEETLSTVKDLVGTSRSYALTGKPQYLDMYAAARDSLPPMLSKIQPLLSDNPEQLRRLDTIRTLVAQRVLMAQRQIEQKDGNQQEIFSTGQEIYYQIRGIFMEMKAVEADLLTQRSRQTEERALLTKYAIVVGNLLSIAILISVFWRLRREMQQRHLAQLHAQRSAKESEDLYNLAPCGYHSIGLDGTFIKINDTGLEWLGYTREEVVGKMRVVDVMSAESRRHYYETAFPQFLRDNRIQGQEMCFVRKDGSHFYANLAATAVRGRDGRFLMSRTVITDITERKHSERQIEILNEALHKRAAELELANKELEGFSYSVSHDLRAPLRVIGGYALMLEEDFNDKLDDEGRRYINVIRANTRKMDTLIVDLLRLARSTLTQLVIGHIDMQQMACQVVKDLELGGGNVAIDVENLHDADANPTLIKQVWENLLTNAAKFSGKNPQPTVKVSSLQSAHETCYCVADNGIGFDPQSAPRLFEVFQRFHTQEQFPGTGVGLALVKRIVVRHGGRLWAESAPGEGARFYFALPRLSAAQPGIETDIATETRADIETAATTVATTTIVTAGTTTTTPDQEAA